MLFVFRLVFFIKLIQSSFISIDFGTEFYKIVLVSNKFTIIENSLSKRKTPNSLLINSEQRLFGYDSLSKKSRFPRNVYSFLYEFLGKSKNDTLIKRIRNDLILPFEYIDEDDRLSISFKVSYDKKEYYLQLEDLIAMQFQYIKSLSESIAKQPITECYFTFPNFFSYKERLRLIHSAEISGLKVLGITSDNVGAAVFLGWNQKFKNSQNIIIYNIGSSYTQATLVSYNTIIERNLKNNITSEYNSIKVLSETYEREIGGRRIDVNLANYIKSLIIEKNKVLPSGNSDVLNEKLLQTANKLKEILSANKETSIELVGIENIKLQNKINRDEFNELNKELLNKITDPIDNLIQNANLTIDEVDQIELIGGTTRIPEIQEILKKRYGKDKIGLHLNSDEAVVFGSSILGAQDKNNLKDSKFKILHGLNSQYKLRLISLESSIECKENPISCRRKMNKEIILFKFREGFDISKTISIAYLKDFKVLLYEKIGGNEKEEEIISYFVNVSESIADNRINGTAGSKVFLRFYLDKIGKIHLKGELKIKLSPEEKIDIKIIKQNTYPLPLNKTKRSESERILKEFDIIDKRIAKTKEMRNYLESRLYELQQILDDSTQTDLFLLNQEKLDDINRLNIIRIWYEEEGFSATLEQIEDKINELDLLLINQRRSKYNKYLNSCDNFMKEMSILFQKAIKIAESRPWTQKFFNTFSNKHTESLIWFDKMKVSQDLLKLYNETVLTSEKIDEKLAEMQKLLEEMLYLKPSDVYPNKQNIKENQNFDNDKKQEQIDDL